MMDQDLKTMKVKLTEAEKIKKLINKLESNIKVINAELSQFPGEKNLMVRDKWNSIVPTSVFPYTPTDDELIALGEFIQDLYRQKIKTLKEQFQNL